MPVLSFHNGFAHDRLPPRLIVIGAGSHARVVCAILQMARLTKVEFADPALIGGTVSGIPVVGDDCWVLKQDPSEVALVNAIGSTARPEARASAFLKFRSAGFRFATLVHPSATMDDSVQLCEGVQLMAGSIVQAGVKLSENALINTGAIIDHDSTVSAHCHIAPGATLCGNVHIGEGSHVGAGSTVIQSVRIGSRCLVAAGSVVVRDVPDGDSVLGHPARSSQDEMLD